MTKRSGEKFKSDSFRDGQNAFRVLSGSKDPILVTWDSRRDGYDKDWCYGFFVAARTYFAAQCSVTGKVLREETASKPRLQGNGMDFPIVSDSKEKG